MGMHIRLWKDQAHTQVFRDFATGVIAEYGTYSGTIQTVTINDTVYYYANSAVFSGLNATVGTPVVSSKDDLGTQGDPQINIFWPDQDFKCVISGRVDGTGGSARYRATLGNIRAGSTTICASTAGYQSTTAECDVWAYTIRLQGFDVDFVYITQDKIDGYIGSSYGIMVSANVFETSLQTRFGRDSVGDEDSGYGDGEGGDGQADTAGPDGNAMPIGGSGIHAYKVSDSVYNSIAAKLWGQDENIFTALWYKFQNFRFTPIAGIINCIRIPSNFSPAGVNSKIKMAGLIFDDIGAEITTQKVQATFTTDGAFPQYFNDYNDDTNTRITLHLPFCGTVDLAPSAVCGRVIVVNYWCDVLTGNVSARVSTSIGAADPNGGRGNGGGFIAQGAGNCAYSVPMSGNDSGMGDKLATIKSFATGQVNAAASLMGGGNPSTGDIMSGSTPALMAGMFLAKHSTSVVGAIGGGVGYIADLAVRITVERIVPVKPANYDTTKGFMSVTGATVGTYTGFSVFSSVNVSVSGATDEEKAEIERLLKEGVYI